ncbi:hypothetical protein Q9966_000560 [Columba livia]|nr:hypothetical protein Q9966_000560 [Columba livia]
MWTARVVLNSVGQPISEIISPTLSIELPCLDEKWSRGRLATYPRLTVNLQHSMLLHGTPEPSQEEIAILYAVHLPQYGTTKQFETYAVLSGQGITPICLPTMFRSRGMALASNFGVDDMAAVWKREEIGIECVFMLSFSSPLSYSVKFWKHLVVVGILSMHHLSPHFLCFAKSINRAVMGKAVWSRDRSGQELERKPVKKIEFGLL